MANMFALILVIATLVTGLLWCLDSLFSPQNAVNVRLPRRQPLAISWTRRP